MSRVLMLFCVAGAMLTPVLGWCGTPGTEITASVLDQDGSPLAGATAELYRVPSRYRIGRQELRREEHPAPVCRTVTDRFGELVLAVPAPGMWLVRVSTEAHLSVQYRLEPLLTSIDLGVVVLPAATTLQVTATTPAGAAMAGVRVALHTAADSALPAGTPGLHWRLAPRATWTDGTGTALLQVAADETREVSAGLPGGPMVTAAAARHQLDLVVPGRPAGRSVRLLDEQSRAVADALVRDCTGQHLLGLADEQGLVHLPADIDSEQICVEAAAGWSARVLVPAAAASAAPASVVQLTRPPLLTGTVRGPQGPVAGALVWFGVDPGAMVQTGTQGSFTLPDPGPGPRMLQVAAAGFFPERLQVPGEPAPSAIPVSTAGEGAGKLPPLRLQPAVTVNGRAVDSAGRPWAGVLLQVDAGSREARQRWTRTFISTAPDGRFVVPYLVPGQPYSLLATGSGLSTLTRHFTAAQETGQPMPITLVLTSGQTVVGTVLDTAQEPVVGVQVSLLPEHPGDDRAPRPTATNEQGRFLVDGVAAARYRLQVAVEGQARLDLPGIEVAEGAGPLDLGTLTLAGPATLAGTVVNEQAEPLAGAVVEAWVEREEESAATAVQQRWRTRTDAAGAFQLAGPVAGSRVVVTATCAEYAGRRLEEILVPGTGRLEIVLVPGARLAGRVVTADGGPLEQALVELTVEEPVQTSSSAVLPPSSIPRIITVKQSGAFAVSDAEPGRLRLRARARGYSPATLTGVEVKPGGETRDLRLVLQPGAALFGTISDRAGQPVTNAMVAVQIEAPGEPGASSTAQQGTAVSDESGAYELGDLPAGAARVEVRHVAYSTVTRELQLDRAHRLDIELAGGLELSGRVTAGGAPVAGAEVTLVRGTGMPLASARSGGDGSFAVSTSGSGRYRLLATHDGFGPATSPELELAGAPLTGIELELQPALAVTGRLLGLGLADLAEVEVMAGSSTLGVHSGTAGADGRYRIDGLSPGEWRLGGWVPRSHQQAEATVVLTAGDGVVEIDLDFAAGELLEGQVLLDGKALVGAAVTVEGQTMASYGDTVTGASGSFAIDGLLQGSYRLQVDQGELGIHYTDELQVPAGHGLVISIRSDQVKE